MINTLATPPVPIIFDMPTLQPYANGLEPPAKAYDAFNRAAGRGFALRANLFEVLQLKQAFVMVPLVAESPTLCTPLARAFHAVPLTSALRMAKGCNTSSPPAGLELEVQEFFPNPNVCAKPDLFKVADYLRTALEEADYPPAALRVASRDPYVLHALAPLGITPVFTLTGTRAQNTPEAVARKLAVFKDMPLPELRIDVAAIPDHLFPTLAQQHVKASFFIAPPKNATPYNMPVPHIEEDVPRLHAAVVMAGEHRLHTTAVYSPIPEAASERLAQLTQPQPKRSSITIIP